MSNSKNIASKLSEHLFWDVNKATFNAQEHLRWLIERIVKYGTLDDWSVLKSHYPLKELQQEAKKIRSLNPVDLNFLSFALKLPKSDFRCYTETW